jgi:hypothetical protein
MGSSKELLLIHRNMGQVNLSHSVNIMLTPQFYTMKKETLPLKYQYQAKRIAPSMFDGLLDTSGSYDYLVYRENNTWVFIAYDTESIKNFLASKGIKAEQVAKMFFAQQALQAFTKPVYLGEKEALLALEDNAVVIVPQSALDEFVTPHHFSNAFTPKNGVSLQGTTASLLSIKQAVAMASIFLLFAGIFFIEGSRYGGGGTQMQEEMKALLEANPSLQSQYTRESVASKYRAIDQKERKKREAVKTLAHMIFKGVTLSSLTLTDKGYKAEFICANAKVSKKLISLAKNEKMKSTKVTETTIALEGGL